MNFLEGNQLVKSNPFHRQSRCPTPPTGSLVAVGAMSLLLSDSNSSERACGGGSLRFFGVAPPLLVRFFVPLASVSQSPDFLPDLF
jgi:hypothetical protein